MTLAVVRIDSKSVLLLQPITGIGIQNLPLFEDSEDLRLRNPYSPMKLMSEEKQICLRIPLKAISHSEGKPITVPE